MKKTWIVNIRILSLVMVLVLLTGCSMPIPRSYSSESIEAWVVDFYTGKPVEGVVVVAEWKLYGGIHSNVVGQLMVMETVSDKNGHFYFPAWGPKTTFKGYLRNAPRIIFFKNGYEWKGVSNSINRKTLLGKVGPVIHSEWNGKVAKLNKFHGSLEEYRENLFDLSMILRGMFEEHTSDCGWSEIPSMSQAIHEAYGDFPVRYRWCQPLEFL